MHHALAKIDLFTFFNSYLRKEFETSIRAARAVNERINSRKS